MACILLVFSEVIEKCIMMVIVFCRDYVNACVLYDSSIFCNTYSLNVDNSNINKHEINHLLLPFIYIFLW